MSSREVLAALSTTPPSCLSSYRHQLLVVMRNYSASEHHGPTGGYKRALLSSHFPTFPLVLKPWIPGWAIQLLGGSCEI